LLDAGHRPGQIVALPVEELQRITLSLVAGPQALPQGVEGVDHVLQASMAMLRRHDIDGLRSSLHQAVASMGVKRFVTELLAPLNAMVGDAWMRSEIEVYEEHIYTECVTGVLRQAIHQLSNHTPNRHPRVLLTTFPQEEHAVGLLMAESMLMIQGCYCLPMGVKTPLGDIPKAVTAQQADVVALSFSVSLNPNHVLDGLAELRQLLPPQVEIWAGGRAPVLQRRPPAGVMVISDLGHIETQVQRWRNRGT
jgi:methanogenic corrinoid protein MtbC1